jgi:hypothetical protein
VKKAAGQAERVAIVQDTVYEVQPTESEVRKTAQSNIGTRRRACSQKQHALFCVRYSIAEPEITAPKPNQAATVSTLL